MKVWESPSLSTMGGGNKLIAEGLVGESSPVTNIQSKIAMKGRREMTQRGFILLDILPMTSKF